MQMYGRRIYPARTRCEKNIWPYPLKTDPAQKLKFNGKSLQLIENRKIIKEWPAVSGRSGYQDPKHQSLKNTGPIPAGIYAARLDQLQGIEDLNLWQKIIGNVGRGTWPGLENSWGNYRVWLDPALSTQTFGRNHFSIHGGTIPGSAGCIDLTNQMDSFTNWFTHNSKDVIVEVNYDD